MRPLIFVAVIGLLGACDPIPEDQHLELDNDGDGSLDVAYGGIDCDDEDPTETAGITYYADCDGDGTGNPEIAIYEDDCEPPDDSIEDACDSVLTRPTASWVRDNTDCRDHIAAETGGC